MAAYSWLTFQKAVDALQGRIQNKGFWTAAELQLYIVDALRTWNAFTETWNQDFVFTPNSTWNNTGTLAGSPRLRTVTDADVYTLMQAMLLEPLTGAGTWTGTNQFNLSALQYALQRRRDEVIQSTACNVVQLAPLPAVPGERRNVLADNVLEPRRIRFLGVLANTTGSGASGATVIVVSSNAGIAKGQLAVGAGVPAGTFVTSVSGFMVGLSQPITALLTRSPLQFAQPITLTREDTQAFQYFEPSYLQTNAFPESWSVASDPPQAFDVDNAPSVPGMYDVLALQSGPVFAPPAASLMGIPNDWCWVPMYGALADLLSNESERTDRGRAAYCLKRYAEGVAIMQKANWLLQANINDVPADTPSVFEADSFKPEWQQQAGMWPTLVQAGMDFVAASSGSGSVNTTLVANAPIPATLGDYIQVSRDQWDAILGYAQRVATFKCGGADFEATAQLEKDFYRAAVEANERLMTYGIFTDELHSEGKRESIMVPREEEEQ